MDRAQIDDNLTLLTFAPAAPDLQSLAEDGFKSIVNMRQAGEQGEKLSPEAEAQAARESGLDYLHFPVSPPDLTSANARDFATRLEHLPAPVALHCASGRRASLMGLASWALQNESDAATAAQRGRACGLEVSESDLAPLVDASRADAR